jgi:hypothetical protein
MKLHEELCGTCQIRLEQNNCRQGVGWETVKDRTVWKTYASEGNECYGHERGLGQLAQHGNRYGVLCPLYSLTYE